MNTSMTKAARKRYLQSAGTDGCPYCKADMEEFEYKEMDPVEDGSIEQRVQCLQCSRWWMDVFVLQEVRELCGSYTDVKSVFKEEHLPGGINKMVVDKLNQLIEMYEAGAITKYTLIVMIDELYEKRCVNG